jgi:cytoskeletal protein CcmA (bactofilin family)
VVEGRIEAKIKDCQNLTVAEHGLFTGSAEVDEADIGGRFDGTLTVRKRLTLRSGGVIAGTVGYGELMVETGGRIKGDVKPTGEIPAAAAGAGQSPDWDSIRDQITRQQPN